MIKNYVNKFIENKQNLKDNLVKHPDNYKDLVRRVVEVITDDNKYDDIDPNRIHEIDDGDYQGTLLFVVAAKGYQPSEYWYVKISYGSCSGCDTLKAIGNYSMEPPTEDEKEEYLTLMLHIVQGIKKMSDE